MKESFQKMNDELWNQIRYFMRAFSKFISTDIEFYYFEDDNNTVYGFKTDRYEVESYMSLDVLKRTMNTYTTTIRENKYDKIWDLFTEIETRMRS